MYTVVIIDYNYPDLSVEKQILGKIGARVDAHQCDNEEEVVSIVKHADGIINQYTPISRRVIESLEKCKVIGHYGIGVDTIDIGAATEQGIPVVNVPSYCEDEVSDHALALLLDRVRKISFYHQDVSKGNWDWKVGIPIYSLQSKTLGLTGFGKIARKLAKKADPLVQNILAYDPYIPSEEMRNLGVEKVDFNELLCKSDFVSVHVPLTNETRYLFSTEEFKKMKKSSVIINTSRGSVIDERALAQALKEKEISGAALDVLESEPPAGKVKKSPLWGLENVCLTPHTAWYLGRIGTRTAPQLGPRCSPYIDRRYSTWSGE